MPNQADFYEQLRNQKPTRDTLLVDSKDVEQKLGQAATVVKATYFHPYQMHGSMGSSCAVADVQGDKATIWSPTQGVWYQRSTAAMVLGLKPENVRVIFRRGSGCYGLNGADTVTYDAALLSQAVGKPVRVQLTRKDEMAWENYGNAFLMDERAGLDAQGKSSRGITKPGLRRSAIGRGPALRAMSSPVLGGLSAGTVHAAIARARTRGFNNNSNGVPSYAAALFDGVPKGTGTVRSARVLVHNIPSPFFTGPLRSPARFQNTFAHECFMDELAAHVKADPVEYRLRHLSNQRVIDVLKAAAKAANWDARPSPQSGIRKTGVATGRGVACVAYEGDNGYTGMVTEVEVDQDTGKIAVKRVVVGDRRRPDLESRRPEESGRRRSAARHEPRAAGRGDLGRPEGDLDRLANLSHLAARLRMFPKWNAC